MKKKLAASLLLACVNIVAAGRNYGTEAQAQPVRVITIPQKTTTVNTGMGTGNTNTGAAENNRSTSATVNTGYSSSGYSSGKGRTVTNSAGTMKLDNTTYYSIGQDYREKFIIVHYTAINKETSIKALTNNDVSAHFLVTDDPLDPVYSLVPENKRAWHAGVSQWKTRTNLNDSSIGIEIVNLGQSHGEFVPYKDFQIKNVAVLLRYLVDKYEIPATNILGHSDIAPQRKPDPGALFPWRELYMKYNLGMWYDEATKNMYQNSLYTTFSTIPIYEIQQEFKKFGYGIETTGYYDEQTKNVVKAFQQRFRPYLYDGTVDVETYAILKALNEKYK